MCSILFFTLVFGILDFGQAIWRYNMAGNLAQQGARWASVHGAKSLSPATAAQVESYVQSLAPGMTVSVTTTSANGSHQCTATSVDPSTLENGDAVCVKVQASYGRMTGLIPITSLTLQSTASMIISR